MNPEPFTYAHFMQALQSMRDSMLMPYIEHAIGIYCNITGKSVGPRPDSFKDGSTEYADAFEAANYAIFLVSQKIGSYDPDKGNFKSYLNTALANGLKDILKANGNGYSECPSDLEMDPDSSTSDMEERLRRHVDDAFEAMIKFIDTLPEIKRVALYASAFGQILRPDLENYGRNYADILAEIYHTTASYIRKLAAEGKEAAIAEVHRQGFNESSWAEVSMGLLQVHNPNQANYDKVLKAIPKLDAYEQFMFLRHLAGSIDDRNNSKRSKSIWGGILDRGAGDAVRREDLPLVKDELIQALKGVVDDSGKMALPRVYPGKLINTVKSAIANTPSLDGMLPVIEDKHSLLPEDVLRLLQACLMLPFKLGSYESLEDILNELGVKVIIEPGKPKRMLPPDLPPEERGFWLEMKLRGLYCSDEKVIKLFPDNMKDEFDGKFMKELLVSTLAHEVMHAYFDRPQPDDIPDVLSVEEPMAEFGMLLFLYENRLFYHWAVKDVSSKKTVYRYGYALMSQHLKELGSFKNTPTRRDLERYRRRLF